MRVEVGDAGYTVAKTLTDLRSGAMKLNADSLVIVDEAGIVGTPELRELLTATTNASAKTVLVGDARQVHVFRTCTIPPPSAAYGTPHQLVK